MAGSSRVDVKDQALIDQDVVVQDFRAKVQRLQHKMKTAYNKGYRDVKFSSGSYFLLRLNLYLQKTLATYVHHKLAPKYYGPFVILTCIGSVSYHLGLPAGCKLHDMFHVSLLKPFKGEVFITLPTLLPVEEGRVVPTPCSCSDHV
ncbi:hypothetical protein FXO38_15265 [Capsicum annuum]|uniref:Tf2-1-like SH3-like domain-containing protein n=1 Tax=Capsicum annuum TaxID=4072 RepID=A0A2G2ZX60_CAPAN|nr:hypothetical protein FXO37_22696 [Capsicum annuum]KAF3654176.1 hypothetical protein FXO38_15265 [Capsicum annuum]PHT86541.1 hypothetical protein T459_08647 [Capsicum annuum]